MPVRVKKTRQNKSRDCRNESGPSGDLAGRFLFLDCQLRVACQRAAAAVAGNDPAPAAGTAMLPASRPLPVALDAPTEILDGDAAAATDAAGNLCRRRPTRRGRPVTVKGTL